MSEDSRIIFQEGEKSTITPEEYNAWLEPYNQQVELFDLLSAWCERAVNLLSEEGYSHFSTYGGTYKLTWHPQEIDAGASVGAKAAVQVLRDIRFLHDSIFTKDKFRLANAGINLGLSIAEAHSTPFEMTVIRDYQRKQAQSEAGTKSNKASVGIRLKLSKIKLENPKFSAVQAWRKLLKSAENNEKIISDNGIRYELDTDCSETIQKVVSFNIDTEKLDGSGIRLSTLKKIYSKIKP